jgi:hypothetical protein
VRTGGPDGDHDEIAATQDEIRNLEASGPIPSR